MASLYERHGSFWLSYYEGGRRCRVSLHTKDKKIANFRKNEIENKLAVGDSPLPDHSITMAHALKEFVAYSEVSNRPRTIKYYEQTLNPFIKSLPVNIKIHQFKEGYLTTYINQRKKLKQPGAWHLIKVVNTLLNFCVKKKYLTSNPIFIKKPVLPQRVPECWSQEQVQTVLENAHGLLYQAVFINLYLGLRPNELTRLRWQDVDFKEKLITVQEAKDNKFRKIPLHNELAKYLKTLPRESEMILPRLTEKFMRDSSEGIRKAAGLSHIKRFWYSIRHTFATEYYKQTGDLKGLQEILGHSKIEMTTVYVNPQQAHQHKQLNRLSYQIDTNLDT